MQMATCRAACAHHRSMRRSRCSAGSGKAGAGSAVCSGRQCRSRPRNWPRCTPNHQRFVQEWRVAVHARSHARVPACRRRPRSRPGRRGLGHREVGARRGDTSRATDFRRGGAGRRDQRSRRRRGAGHASRARSRCGARRGGRHRGRAGNRSRARGSDREGLDVELAGLCDAGEERGLPPRSSSPVSGATSPPRGWRRSVSSCVTPTSRTSSIRALGAPTVEQLIESAG